MFWATLVPGGGQLQEILDIWERLDDSRTFRDLVDQAQDEFEDETGIDFETGVMPWIGPEFSLGVLEADWSREEWVVAGMIGVRDGDTAEEFFRDWLEYMENEHYTEFHDETYEDFRHRGIGRRLAGVCADRRLDGVCHLRART